MTVLVHYIHAAFPAIWVHDVREAREPVLSATCMLIIACPLLLELDTHTYEATSYTCHLDRA